MKHSEDMGFFQGVSSVFRVRASIRMQIIIVSISVHWALRTFLFTKVMSDWDALAENNYIRRHLRLAVRRKEYLQHIFSHRRLENVAVPVTYQPWSTSVPLSSRNWKSAPPLIVRMKNEVLETNHSHIVIATRDSRYAVCIATCCFKRTLYFGMWCFQQEKVRLDILL